MRCSRMSSRRRECPEAPAKHGGGAEDGVVALTWLPRLQHREQRWRDASYIDIGKALFEVIGAEPAALTTERGERLSAPVRMERQQSDHQMLSRGRSRLRAVRSIEGVTYDLAQGLQMHGFPAARR